MPKALENKLKKEAASKGLKGEHADAYVYGTLRKTGWKPKREKRHVAGMSEHDVVYEPVPDGAYEVEMLGD